MKFRLAAAVLLAGAAAASAQTSELFLFSYQTQQTYVVQGGQLMRQWQNVSSNEFVGAVTPNEIRTVGANGSTVGQEYDLNGNVQGPTFAQPGIANIYDGTTDGVNHNYSVTYSNGNLYRHDRNWQNPQLLFNIGSGGLGVAFDANTQTIWAVGNSGQFATNYDLNGNVLSQFVPGNSVFGVAFDAADNTLWMSGDSSSQLYQYSTNGQLLQSIDKVGLWGARGTLGMEFAIPAPGAAALLGLGTLAAARRRRA